MRTLRATLLAAALALPCAEASAQSNPGWSYGYVPTASQWNAQWASKQDFLGASPLLTTGGIINGPVTFNGFPVTFSSAPLIISGNLSQSAWTTSGIRIQGVVGTMTDTTSAGTVAAAYTDVLGGNTIAASNVVTFTNYVSSYYRQPVAGANVTFTHGWALGADSVFVGAGTATVPPIGLTAGTNLTTAVAGAHEYDGNAFYQTPGASNRGVTANYHFERLTSNYTLGNVNTPQKAFNGTASGQITVPPATGYRFKLKYLITNTGTTSHQWQVLLGGTATLTSGTMSCNAVSSTSSAVATPGLGYTTTLGTAFTVTAASTSATENATIDCDGTVNVNASGTLIPEVQLTAATGTAATMLAGSFFEMWAVGSNAVVSVGNWN